MVGAGPTMMLAETPGAVNAPRTGATGRVRREDRTMNVMTAHICIVAALMTGSTARRYGSAVRARMRAVPAGVARANCPASNRCPSAEGQRSARDREDQKSHCPTPGRLADTKLVPRGGAMRSENAVLVRAQLQSGFRTATSFRRPSASWGARECRHKLRAWAFSSHRPFLRSPALSATER